MRKQLLIGSALLAAISAFTQNVRTGPKTSPGNMAEVIAAKFALDKNASAKASQLNIPAQENTPEENAKTASPLATSISWQQIGGAMNVYGMLVSQSKPLQYNNNVNAISFIHRKSSSYIPNPSANSNSGTIVAEISSNWGGTWDSTAIYADAVNAGRYPQGGIYNPPGNSNIANAYVVATGVVVANNAFEGSFYASKQLGAPGSAAYNNSPDATPGAQLFVSNNSTTYSPTFDRHGWSRTGFSSTDDGLVRSLASIADNHAGDGNPTFQRGVGIVKGTFNAGIFNWTMDSVKPSALLASDGSANMLEGQMAWNESGTVGYVVIPGTLASATGNNLGNQPIIYKTTNSGISWAPLAPIDFNSAGMQPIVNHLYTVGGSTNTTSPYMSDWDITVDGNNNLHIGAIFMSGASIHPDSIYYYQTFQVGIDVYKYTHAPGDRPYLYDFVGDGTSAWAYTLIDSLPTEDPGANSTDGGYAENPWDIDAGSKIAIDPRVQLGRTPSGDFITYSWTESDTNFTNGGKKYNTLPNIKTRCSVIGAGTSMTLSPTELNATKYPVSQGINNAAVNSRATLHYMSSTTSAGTLVISGTTSTVDIFTPLTVTNSNPYAQLGNNVIWFGAARMSYAFTTIVNPGPGVGIEHNTSASVLNSIIYPNPAKNSAFLSVDLKNNSNISVSVYNTIGQLVKATLAEGQVGENNINIDFTNLTTGIYIVNVKVGNTTTTKKLIVE